MNIESKEIGKNIARLRKAAGLTQVQVCEKLGTTQPAFAGYETGRRAVPVDLILPIAEVLNVNLNDIFGITPSEAKAPGPKPRLTALLEDAQDLPKAKQKLITDMLEVALRSK